MSPTIGRQPPHSSEAEEYLLSCCLLDGSESIEKCQRADLPGAAFFFPANRIIYEKIVELYLENPPVAVEILAEELTKSGELENVGGLPYLMQVSSRIPTTAQTDYFLDRVRELHTLRQLIKVGTSMVEQSFTCSGGVEGLLGQFAHDITGIERSANNDRTWQASSFIDFKVPPVVDSSILLGKYRYICRGGTLIVVGPSHVGKSSLCFQWAVAASLARPMLKIETHGRLTSLIINGEDDDGDVGEVAISMPAGMSLSEADIAEVRKRVHVIKARMETGEEFFKQLKRAVAKYKPDLVWINPLLAFAGLDITKPGEASKLRAMLNSANVDESFAYMLVHHTNKPPSQQTTGNSRAPERNWNEFMYQMTGAADIVNLARAVITIEAKKERGDFLLRLAKRGKRAGVTRTLKADPEKGRAVYKTEIITEIHASHSDKMITLPDGRELPMIFWNYDEDGAEKAEEAKQNPPPRGGAAKKYDLAIFRPVFLKLAHGKENRKGYNALHRACCQIQKIGGSAFNRILDEAVEGGVLNREPDGYYVPDTRKK